MKSSLTRQILGAHAATRGRAGDLGQRPLSVDHVVVDRAATALVFAALESSRLAPRAEILLVCLDRVARHYGLGLGDEHGLAERARRLHAHVSHSGNGGPDAVYTERFAAPGKLALAAGSGTPSCGALGTVPLRATAIETAYVLGGGPHHHPRAPVLGLRLQGGFGPWVSGHDLALEIGHRLPARLLTEAVIELFGPGVVQLSMADRLATAAQAPGFGALAALFPSDETTRRYLKAQHREADWKALQGDEDAVYDGVAEIDLDTIEPLIAATDEPSAARPVRQLKGMRIRRVVVGAGATAADLACLAVVLEGRAVHEAIELVIVSGSRQSYETAARRGSLAALVAAGARVLEGGAPEIPFATGNAGNVLAFGEPARGEKEMQRERRYVASPATCAAAALAGHLVDPRELECGFRRDLEPESYALEPGGVLGPLPESAEHTETTDGTIPLGRPLEGPLRGVVLARVGDHVRTDQMLPWGARMEPMAADLPRLSQHAFAALDSGLVSRARRYGGGFLVAGHGFGDGAEREQAALIPVALGIRVVLARSFDPAFRRQLVNAGVLPLRLRLEADYRTIAPGDELEIPSLPEILEPGKPIEVRNLTRGIQHTLPHDLDARETQLVRVGGLLRFGIKSAVQAEARSRSRESDRDPVGKASG